MDAPHFARQINCPDKVQRKKKVVHKGTTGEQSKGQLTMEVDPVKEEKILNTSSNKNVLFCTLDVLEEVLNNLTIGDDDEEILEKLLQTQDLIQTKLQTFQHVGGERCEKADDVSFIKNLASSKSLASSMQSLCSQKSVSSVNLKGNKKFQEFLKRVNCPFCSKVEDNKISLINHLDGNCQSLINNMFEERNFIPFSAYQILPNDTIKCNICYNTVLKDLKSFFVHLGKPQHKIEYNKAVKLKQYTEFLFCSCCKVLVPNNHTQIDFHIRHEIHKSRSATAPNSKAFKNVDCVYLKTKRFKCLDCQSKSFYQSAKEILIHFEKKNHGAKLKSGMFPKVFCEICLEEVHIFELLSHLNSHSHTTKEKALSLQDCFEMCYYCGFICLNLKELSVHMKIQCKEITRIQQQNLKSEKLCKYDSVKNDVRNENKNAATKDNNPTKEKVSGEKDAPDLHIILKDNNDIIEAYRYFKKFGEITRFLPQKGNNVLIQFRDKSAFDDVLLLRDVIYINGSKVEIITGEELTEPSKVMEESEKEINLEDNSERQLDLFYKRSRSSSNSEDTDDLEAEYSKNTELEDLFERVSLFLSNSTKTFDSNLEEKILGDCARIFGPDLKFSAVGFTGARLSFPVEMIDLYCDRTEDIKTQSLGGIGILPCQKNLVKSFYVKFCDASEWQSVKCRSELTFPHIECTHVATRKSCTFTFMPSAKVLTDMLSYCNGKVNGAENFCLIVRFWITVHNLNIGKLDFVVISLLIFFLMAKYNIRASKYNRSNDYVFNFMSQRTISLCDALYRDIGCKLDAADEESIGSSNVVEMFKEFLKFLLKFNFQKSMICLPVNYPVPIKYIASNLYQQFFKSIDLRQINDSAMCIIDPLQYVNLGREVSHNDLKSLLEAARSTLKNTR